MIRASKRLPFTVGLCLFGKICVVIILALSPGFIAAQTQSKAVATTNYRISLNLSETDNIDSNTAHMNLVMPAGEFSGFGLNYDFATSTTTDIDLPESEFETETSGYGISYFLRDYTLGRIGYQVLHLDLEQELENPIPNIEPAIVTDKRELDVENVYGEFYMANTTLAYYKIKSEYENLGKLKDKKWLIHWYFSKSLRVSYHSNEAEIFNSMDKTETTGIDITYQPSFVKNFGSITLGYSRDKDNEELDQVSLVLDFYFQSPVGLKDRDRKFQ